MITTDRIKYLSEVFTGWSPKEINIAYQMLIFLKKVKIDQEEFAEYADHIQKERFFYAKAMKNLSALKILWFEEHPYLCPKCGMPMNIGSVNDKNCTQVGGKWQSVWTCVNMENCGHQIWKMKSAIFEFNKWTKPFNDKWGKLDIDELLSKDIDKIIKSKLKATSDRRKNKPCGGCKEK